MIRELHEVLTAVWTPVPFLPSFLLVDGKTGKGKDVSQDYSNDRNVRLLKGPHARFSRLRSRQPLVMHVISSVSYRITTLWNAGVSFGKRICIVLYLLEVFVSRMRCALCNRRLHVLWLPLRLCESDDEEEDEDEGVLVLYLRVRQGGNG